MTDRPARSASERFADGDALDAAVAKGVREALLDHARAGNPVAAWRDGRVVWLGPEEVFAVLARETSPTPPDRP